MESFALIKLPELLTFLAGSALVVLFTTLYNKGAWTREHKRAAFLEREGDRFFATGLWGNAIDRYQQGIAIREKEMQLLYVLTLSKKLGRCYRETGDNDRAMQYFVKCETIWDQLRKDVKMYEIYDELALIHLKRCDLKLAAEYSRKAIESQRVINSARLPVSLAIGARIAKERDNFEEAEKLYCEATERADKTGDIYGLASLYYDLGELKKAQKAIDKAIVYYKKSGVYFEKLGSARTAEIEEKLKALNHHATIATPSNPQ